MKKLVLVLVILSSMVLSVSCGGENGGSGSVGTATFNNQNLNSFVGLPPEVVEQFQNNIKGKSFEEIYSYALAQGIDIIVTQVEDLQYFDTQYFNIPDQYTNKNEAVTTYFRRVSEISNCTAYFDFHLTRGLQLGLPFI